MSFNFLGGFQKNKSFCRGRGDENFGGHHKTGLFWGVISIRLGLFLNIRPRYRT